MLEAIRNLFPARGNDPASIKTVAAAETAFARMKSSRAEAQAKIDSLRSQREDALLTASEEKIAEIDRAADAEMLLLERFDRLEPLLIERLQELRADEKRRRWRDIRHRYLEQASVVARAQRAALEAIESLRVIGQEALGGGLQIEAGSLPIPPMIHDRELVLMFETAIERQASAAPEPTPVKKPKQKPTAAPAGFDHHESMLNTRRAQGGAIDVRILPPFVERGGKNLKAYSIVSMELKIAEQLIADGRAERWPPPATPTSLTPPAPTSPSPSAVEALPAPMADPAPADDLPRNAAGEVDVVVLQPKVPLPRGGRSGMEPEAEIHSFPAKIAQVWISQGKARLAPLAAQIEPKAAIAEIAPATENVSAEKVEAAA